MALATARARRPGDAQVASRARLAAVHPRPVARRVLGYVALREDDLDHSGLREAAAAIEAASRARGWELVRIVHDRVRAAGSQQHRPALAYALEQLAAPGGAGALVVGELRHVAGSVRELAPLLQWCERSGAGLVALDVALDTSTAAGMLAVRALASVSDWERQRMAARTREGLAAASARGRTGPRPAVRDHPVLRERIMELRGQGLTLQAIADRLNREGVPTLRGGREWRPSSVQSAVGYRRPRGRTAAPIPSVLPLAGVGNSDRGRA